MKKLFFIFSLFCSFIATSQGSAHEKGQILIQLEAGTDPIAFIRNFETSEGLSILKFQELSKIAGIYQVIFTEENLDLDQLIKLFYSYTEIQAAQKNHLLTIRETIPTDTLFAQQWFHKNTGQTGGVIDADIDTPEAWDITTGGTTTHNDSIVVCIIEGGGVDITHIDIKENVWHNYAEIPNNGIDDDNNGYIDDFDGWNVSTLADDVGFGSHGTRVTGMVGGKGNNVTGISGVNWDVKLMIVKGQVASNEASVIAAYNYPLVMRKKYNETFGQEGAFVVVTNSSWGIDGGNPANAPLWCAMYDTMGTYGILSVAATTNNNSNIDVVGDLPTTCSSQYLIAATMTNADDVRANSGYGPINVDLAAPGSGVLLPIPGNLYVSTNGTSFASPCVAGAVALTYSAPCTEFITYVKNDPSGAALAMKDYILSSVDIIAALSGEVGTGGRLNVKSAIDSLLANCTLSACNQPYNLHGDNITDTTGLFTWDGFSTDYLFYIQENGGSTIEIPIISQNTLNIDTLSPCTNYTIWTRAICGLDTSANSYPYNFTTDGCCNNPDLILDDQAYDSLYISWNPILYATEYDVRYRKQGETLWEATLTDTVSPIVLGGLDTCATYEVQIKTLCTDSTHGFSNSFLFATIGCGVCYELDYCEVIGGNSATEWIDSIVVNGAISKTGPNGGWYESTAVLTGLIQGQTYPVFLKPGYSGTIFTERFSLWIDVDQNGIFDASEAFISNVTTTSQISTTIDIPLAALNGVTKMRIGMNGTANPAICPTASFWGEYEDYCVYIGADAGVDENELEVSLYPNPFNNEIFVSSVYPIEQIMVFSADGKLVVSKTGSTKSINLSQLEKGIYIVHLQINNQTVVRKIVKQ